MFICDTCYNLEDNEVTPAEVILNHVPAGVQVLKPDTQIGTFCKVHAGAAFDDAILRLLPNATMDIRITKLEVK